jgi:CMP-N-acetylneuraminic acid synthetase
VIAGQRVLGVIAARGGSKRVPGKNIRNCPSSPWQI